MPKKSPRRKHKKSPRRKHKKSPRRKHKKSPRRKNKKSPRRKHKKGSTTHNYRDFFDCYEKLLKIKGVNRDWSTCKICKLNFPTYDGFNVNCSTKNEYDSLKIDLGGRWGWAYPETIVWNKPKIKFSGNQRLDIEELLGPGRGNFSN